MKARDRQMGRPPISKNDQDRMAVAKKFFEETRNLVEVLAERWMDEKGGEDIEEYRAKIQEEASKYGITVLNMVKRPFGFTWTLREVQYKTLVMGTTYSYKRIWAYK